MVLLLTDDMKPTGHCSTSHGDPFALKSFVYLTILFSFRHEYMYMSSWSMLFHAGIFQGRLEGVSLLGQSTP